VIIDECDACGADLYLDVVHHCPVGGNDVVISKIIPPERAQTQYRIVKEEQGDG
jgi:hypothetical protein